MFLGMAYHPDYWPKERWPIDARLMAECHIEAVRVGEFAWCRFEPREGQLDFRRSLSCLSRDFAPFVIQMPSPRQLSAPSTGCSTPVRQLTAWAEQL